MKKCILLVVLFLVVGIATFGQTAFIDRGGKVELVPVEVKVDTLIIIPEDLSEIENLPGTLDQKLWALQNPGRDTLVDEVNLTVYSKLGFSAQTYEKEIWLKFDGQTLASYPKLIPCGQERPAWESYIVSAIVLLISYIVGRHQKLYKDKLSFFGLKSLFAVVFILMFLFEGAFYTGAPVLYFFYFCVFVAIIVGFLLIDYWTIEMLILLIIICVLGFGYGSFIGALQIVLVLCGLSAAGYLIAYNTTKKKTEPEHTNEAVKLGTK